MIHKIKTFISKPGHLFRYSSFSTRKYYYTFSKYMHLKTYLSRKFSKPSKFTIPSEGFLKITPKELATLGIDHNKIISEVNSKEKNKNFELKVDDPITKILDSDDFEKKSNTFNFATNKNLTDIISNYLGIIPLLTHIQLWYSPNNQKVEGSSQFYHLDHEDYKQIKCFFFLEDISEDNGPTITLNKKKSLEIINKFNYKTDVKNKRLYEEKIKNFIKDNEISCVGEKGTLFLVDVSACLHYGSRKSNKSRKILMFQFLTPFSTSLKWKWKKSNELNKPYWKDFSLVKRQKQLLGLI